MKVSVQAHAGGCAPKVIPVILSGGSGSRLWPVSRASNPKQFWPILGDKSLLEETLRRVRPFGVSPLVVTGEDQRFMVAEQILRAGGQAEILLEPAPRNSAPAIAAACFLAVERDSEAIVWILPADAHMEGGKALHDAVSAACGAAEKGFVVMMGIKPHRPETGYGYIHARGALANVAGVLKVRTFLEKPERAKAEIFCKTPDYYWNSGIFIARASVILEEIKHYEPELYEAVRQAVLERKTESDFTRLGASFSRAPEISIDYAVAERTSRAALVPVRFRWSDVGSWEGVYEVSPHDSQGNVLGGDVVVEDAKNVLVRSDGILTALCGVENIIVISTPDAVLVTAPDRTQDIKKLVERLKGEKRPEATAHRRVCRPWGFYETLSLGDRYQVKLIEVAPGKRLSLQKHFHRAEHWVVVAGTGEVTRGKEILTLRENESVYIPLGEVHRLENSGSTPLKIIEVQSGAYLGEDDIVRFEDDFRRV